MTNKGIILTQNDEFISLLMDVGAGLQVSLEFFTDIAEYLLALQADGFVVTIFDCNKLEAENLKWIKIIRRIRPKLPLIVISKDINPDIGAEMYEEGTFNYQQHPVDCTILREVLASALNTPKPV